jgi:hypothetical protein
MVVCCLLAYPMLQLKNLAKGWPFEIFLRVAQIALGASQSFLETASLSFVVYIALTQPRRKRARRLLEPTQYPRSAVANQYHNGLII